MKRGRDAQDCINEAQRSKDIDLAKFLCGTMSSHLSRDQLCKLARRANISVGPYTTKGMICKRLAEVLEDKLIYTKKNGDDNTIVYSKSRGIETKNESSNPPILRTLGAPYGKKEFRWSKLVKDPVRNPNSRIEKSRRKRKERKRLKKLEKLKQQQQRKKIEDEKMKK